MTIYRVWLTDDHSPRRIDADGVVEQDGTLYFIYIASPAGGLRFEPERWHRWTVVHDEADMVHL